MDRMGWHRFAPDAFLSGTDRIERIIAVNDRFDDSKTFDVKM